MKKYTGKGVYGAYAIGKISLFVSHDISVERYNIEDITAEKERVKKAIRNIIRGIMISDK